jgi:hypothetical protein
MDVKIFILFLFCKNLIIILHIPSTSPRSTRNHVASSTTVSSNPPTREAITGITPVQNNLKTKTRR